MKNVIKQFAFVAICAIMLFCGSSCQKEIESDADSGVSYEPIVVGYIDIDTTRKCVSKKSHYAEESSVFVCDRDGLHGSTYKTIKLMSDDLKVIQEWFVEYLHSNQVSDYHIGTLDPDGSKYGYFYKWRGSLYQMSTSDFRITKEETGQRYYRLPDNMKVKGFRLPTTKDIEELYSMFTRPEEAESELQFKMYGYDIEFQDYCRTRNVDLTKGMWVDAGSYANENTERYGMYVCIPTKFGNDDIRLFTTNNPDVYGRVRLMRTLTLEQWEEE